MISIEQLWQFSVEQYQQLELQRQLLTAQNESGANVNLALLCLFLDKQNQPLSLTQIQQLHLHLQAFSNEFTQPLRQLRLDFKLKQQQISTYNALRTHLLSAELELEKQEQALLLDMLSKFSLPPNNLLDKRSNLDTYLGSLS